MGKHNTRWMLLGIFLGVAAVWCLLAGSGGSTVLAALGFYLLPIMALVCFLTGFSGQGEPQEPPEPGGKDEEGKP